MPGVRPSEEGFITYFTGATGSQKLLDYTSSGRIGASVFNDSAAALYIAAASTGATSTVYTVKVAAGGYWEAPYDYAGPLYGAWAAATGAALVTEFR
jgi:hypothetical protein